MIDTSDADRFVLMSLEDVHRKDMHELMQGIEVAKQLVRKGQVPMFRDETSLTN